MYNDLVDFNEALERGLLIEVRLLKPLNEAFAKGLQFIVQTIHSYLLSI